MPTVEDYFDDDTDLPLPSSSKGHLPSTGLQGALLEEITDDNELDFDQVAEQGRGEYGADSKAPPPSAKGKNVVRSYDNDVQRPQGGGPQINPNTPMGGFMGDMMKLQEVEEARMAKLKSQFGNTTIAQDPSLYKSWNSVYPLYFDAKASVKTGRRVPRDSALWWPLAAHIARACSSLGLSSVLEPEKTHPADWENPGRVKVQFQKDGRFLNPIIKNRTQLYIQLARQMQIANPSLVPKPEIKAKKADAADNKPKPKAKGGKGKADAKGNKAGPKPVLLPTRTPAAPFPWPAQDERLPIHSPVASTGVAVSAVKRDLETEKENKKKGITSGFGGGGGDDAPPAKEKQPKMKRMVVRGRR
ncbi:Signal recognition particle SEC65 subunit [Vanrija pseudolonga]|uniref:Signal recognition particle SEC65 subunit n=1 Tax=Vanrija pseudolonga TaxID=143232 RepID=A0AAF1BUA8_9TREE|nr:Signal recognition particle SEC65 subunit [Vanrija pseudolonga]